MHDISHLRRRLRFGPGRDYRGPHFSMISSHRELLREYDVLLYLDSRGSAVEVPGERTWVDLFTERLDQRKLSYLCICRPKELTVVFSLLNFFVLNRIRVHCLLTNIGFVDMTPKKKDFVQDILGQMSEDLGKDYSIKVRRVCRYRLNTGRVENLFALDLVDFSALVGQKLGEIARKTLLIGTIELPFHYAISRHRPKAFFQQLKETNAFLRAIAKNGKNIRFVSCAGALAFARGRPSFDAVHLSQRGHQHVFRRLWEAFATLLSVTSPSFSFPVDP